MERVKQIAQKLPSRSSLKTNLFPGLFWIWVVGVSIWIETSPIQSVLSNVVEKKYSQITFTGMHFEQINSDGALVQLKAPSALFNSDTRQLTLTQPEIQWNDSAHDQIVSASSSLGRFSAQLSESALPSAFHYLILSGSAAVFSGTSRVDSETMLFDNDNRMFIFPVPFSFQQGKTKLQHSRMYFEPSKRQNVYPLDDLLKKNPNLKPILESLEPTS